MQWSIPNNNLTYCPITPDKQVHISAHAVDRFIERIAPHMFVQGAFRRLAAELAQASLRCPKGMVRPTRIGTYDSATYCYTPSCVVLIDMRSSTAVTVLAYGSTIDKHHTSISKQNMNRRNSKLRKNALIRKSLSILDSLSVED